MPKDKKPLKIEVDTPNVDVNFERNESGERSIKVKASEMPIVKKIKAIGKLIFGK